MRQAKATGCRAVIGNTRRVSGGRRRADQRETARARQLDPMWHRSKSEPERVEPVVAGRNDPCPCGSGAKVKRCPHPDGFELREQVDA